MDDSIKEAAEKVMGSLEGREAMSVARLVEKTGLTLDLINQAIGWLAREGRLARLEKKHSAAVPFNEARP